MYLLGKDEDMFVESEDRDINSLAKIPTLHTLVNNIKF